MPKLNFTSDELSRYFNGNYKHKGYLETVLMATNMAIHAEGLYPKAMLEERRPSESKTVQAYRMKIWKAITKPIWGKVIVELNKIRRSSDWTLKYDDSTIPPRIIPEETMKAYCEENYPFFTSVTNWVFKVLLPGYCKDANSVVAVMPLNTDAALNEYAKPFGYLYSSEQVFDFVQNDYAVIKSTDKTVYVNEAGSRFFGDIFYIFTTQKIERWEQANGTRVFNLKWEYFHNLGTLPVFRVEGLYKKSLDGTFLFESRLSGMLPRLDEALREYGDLQAEVVQHIFSEKWEMVSDDCPTCKGKCKVRGAGFNAPEIDCPTCSGSGAKPRGPYTNITVRQPMAGEAALPTPPAGYIQKSVEIVKIQDERVEKHEYKALSAINMEYLAETPLNESGKAKEVDKDALNNFVHSIAEDVVAAMDKLYGFICDYRYNVVVADPKERALLKPYINVPEKFDLLSSDYLESQISKQKEGKGNPVIINAMEEDYINKKFAGDNLVRQRILLSLKLDPLSGISEEDKMTRLSNKGVTLENYIISCNVQEFISRALEEKGDGFYSMKLKDQKELMLSYAKEQSAANTMAATIIDNQPGETFVPGKQQAPAA